MQSKNYLIVGPVRKGKQKAFQIINSFFDNAAEIKTNFLIIDEPKVKVEHIEKIQQEMSQTAIVGKKNGYLITKADQMTKDAQNKLLKLLEDSGGKKVQILMCENEGLIIPTLKSRLMVINTDIDNMEDIKTFLKDELIASKYIDLLSSVFNDKEEALNFAQSNVELMENLNKLKLKINAGNQKTIIFFNEFKITNDNYQIILKWLKIIFSENKMYLKLNFLLTAEKNIYLGANPKMQIEQIFLMEQNEVK